MLVLSIRDLAVACLQTAPTALAKDVFKRRVVTDGATQLSRAAHNINTDAAAWRTTLCSNLPSNLVALGHVTF